MRRISPSLTAARLILCIAIFALFLPTARAEDPRTDYAHQLLSNLPDAHKPELLIDSSLNNPEAFLVRTDDDHNTQIVGGGPGGLLYGEQQWAASGQPTSIVMEKPDFELRGTALFLMKDGSYDFQLTPKEFPWFYDRELLTRYLDYLLANRFNTIFLWSGHLFPSIVTMPEYPDATDLSPEQLAQNQDQFRWFTDECAKRNISVLLHFYQINLPVALAKSRGLQVHYSQPNEFAAKFVRYSLGRFLHEFASVGLYVCPGEALRTEYTAPWIKDVILAAAKESGRNPRIVVRDWRLDKEGFEKLCVPEYANMYTELKHNVEMIVSPVPDARHAEWKEIAAKHIVNLHEVADIKPFRWGSPLFIREMVENWKQINVAGAEVYGMTSWRWPYSLDKLEPDQKPFWPAGNKLLTIDRDAIWLQSFGRYLWKVDRPKNDEDKFWTAQLAQKFGNDKAGALILNWYDLTGPILPGLQNLTHVRNMNLFPTAIGREQRIDSILDTAKCDTDYPAKPFDTFFFERYKSKYNQTQLTDRIPMPVAEYADAISADQNINTKMTPDKVVDLLVELAEQSVSIAQSAEKAGTENTDELARFVTDSQAIVLVTHVWRDKIQAAIAKRCFQNSSDKKYANALRTNMADSVSEYEKLVALTDKTYINPTDMKKKLNWHEGLEAFRADKEDQEKFLKSATASHGQ